ncbi:hypothetical protein [Bartonella sp. MM73XJBT.G]|uniref:hypothetical protein n=1 Tax=Bartonella sp. MM73XJBT.G TaxID=3019097 RepID=UPI00235FF7BC|nr:hypothetical protein [Bartonella sp. MM73XJBT.G]
MSYIIKKLFSIQQLVMLKHLLPKSLQSLKKPKQVKQKETYRMSTERKTLDFSELDEFKPRQAKTALNTVECKEIDRAVTFPSREQSDESQINIKASIAIIKRFKSYGKTRALSPW